MPPAIPAAELLFGAEDATPMSTDVATVKPWSQARACVLTVASEALDLVVEGSAIQTVDETELLRIAAAFQVKGGSLR